MNVHSLNSFKNRENEDGDNNRNEYYSGGNDNRGGGRYVLDRPLSM